MLDRAIEVLVLRGTIRNAKLFNTNGRIVYSFDRSEVGQRAQGPEVDRSLGGAVVAEFEGGETSTGERVYEVFVPMRLIGSEGASGVFELYLPYGPIARQIKQDQNELFPILLGGLALLYLALFPVVSRASRRLRRQAYESHHQALHDELTGRGEPAPAAAEARPGDRVRDPVAQVLRAAPARPRPLQGGQRRARPRPRRPPAARRRGAARDDGAPGRPARAARRRRVRAPARRRGRRRRGRGGGRPRARRAARRVRARRRAAARGGERGHRPLPGPRPRRGRAPAGRRHRDVRGQALAQPLRALPGGPRHARQHRQGDPARRAAPRARRGGARALLPAEGRPPAGRRGGRGGADPLAAPGARDAPADGVPAARGAVGPDHLADELRDLGGAAPEPRVELRGPRGPGGGQRLGAQPARAALPE